MTIKAGIIGYGDGGKSNYVGALRANIDVVAICDPDESKLENVRIGNSTIDLYTDPSQLISRNDIDLVIIATPDSQHLTLTKDSLKKGKYVFIEKPVATSLDDINEITLLLDKYEKQMLFSEKYSFSPVVQETLEHTKELGDYICGSTFYVMGNCNRIMGGGKWRTESAYNPCAGGLSHNFMTALLFSNSPIKRIQAVGQVLNYHNNLDKFGGYDYMSGLLQFECGKYLNWTVNLANENNNGWSDHRTVSHYIQFKDGSLAFGPKLFTDKLIINGDELEISQEPRKEEWNIFNDNLYASMLNDVAKSIEGKPSLHNIRQGINVAKACILAFESAKLDGKWMSVD